jgi:hypothetical protein
VSANAAFEIFKKKNVFYAMEGNGEKWIELETTAFID